ncbi:hypothetical protein EJ02DRAFT_354738 [Clathrospora elynae]|uniref:RING-type domain-containing protein n=1 Tax=Clathrospora elynae TaxID=706981 RepID=A0A6A5SF10_9PLEO|nr:hypothetical protein EJ02DRAFT_354738 [Clathrospora elynae]
MLSYDRHSLVRPPVATPCPLPSLLRYVDHDLMQDAAAHDQPLDLNAICPICLLQWDTPIATTVDTAGLSHLVSQPTPAIKSTFLPLSPCGHWLHYRCFIWHTAQTGNPDKNKCFVCRTPLYEWDGMTALTLATRTGLELQDQTQDRYPYDNDREAYEAECVFIDSIINRHFFVSLGQPSKHVDGSPDLISVYYAVLDELDKLKKPQCTWLSWNTMTGFFLFGMLVCVKMRRYLVEGHDGIIVTEGWTGFEEGRVALREKILEDVHKA